MRHIVLFIFFVPLSLPILPLICYKSYNSFYGLLARIKKGIVDYVFCPLFLLFSFLFVCIWGEMRMILGKFYCLKRNRIRLLK